MKPFKRMASLSPVLRTVKTTPPGTCEKLIASISPTGTSTDLPPPVFFQLIPEGPSFTAPGAGAPRPISEIEPNWSSLDIVGGYVRVTSAVFGEKCRCAVLFCRDQTIGKQARFLNALQAPADRATIGSHRCTDADNVPSNEPMRGDTRHETRASVVRCARAAVDRRYGATTQSEFEKQRSGKKKVYLVSKHDRCFHGLMRSYSTTFFHSTLLQPFSSPPPSSPCPRRTARWSSSFS